MNKTSLYTYLAEILGDALLQTLYMIIVPTIVATILGFIMAIILVVTKPKGLKPNKILYSILGFIVNMVRSFPFIILLIALIPFTRFIVGTSIGETAAIVPITIGAAPFIARVIENALNEVDEGLIEAAKSFGATNLQIIFKVMVKEAMPSIVSGITLSIISILGCTAMAGTVGAGGLGKVAIVYGHQRFDTSVMIYVVITLIIMVQLIQSVGDYAYKKLK
ncbi:methionine ABC transporter permease [Terrisporobacter glycolicus]|uniref:methionine ABC transporter permease n=1 Tax=Terrisporobacter glycolicus TaxID=36841 RepID=UPI000B1DAAAD